MDNHQSDLCSSDNSAEAGEPTLWDMLQKDRLLQLVVIVGLVIRLVAAYSSDLFVDEAYSYGVASGSFKSLLWGLRGDSHPPLYYLSMFPLAQITRSTLLLRLPSIVCSMLALLVNYRLIRRIGGSSSAYLVAAMTSVGYTFWLTESQMRMYGYAELGTSLLIELLVLSIEEPTWKPKGRQLTLAWIALLCLPLIHFISGFIQGLSWLWWTVRMRRSPFEPCIGLPMSLGLVLGLGWVVFAAGDPSRSQMLVHSPNQHQFVFPWQLFSFFTGWLTSPGLSWWRGLPEFGNSIVYVTSFAGWILAISGTWKLARDGRRQTVSFLTFIISVCVIALMYGAYVRGAKWFQLRHLIVLGPYLLWSFSQGILRLGFIGRSLFSLTVGLNLIISLSFPADPYWWNQNWSGPARFVEQRARRGDVLFAHNWYSLLGLDYVLWDGAIEIPLVDYAQYAIRIPNGCPITQQIPTESAMLTPELAAKMAGKRCFLVLNQARDPKVREWFLEHCNVLDIFVQSSASSWGELEVFLLQFPNSSP